MEKEDAPPPAVSPTHVERADFWELQAKINLLNQRVAEEALLREQLSRYQRDLPKLRHDVEVATAGFRAKYELGPDDQVQSDGDFLIVRASSTTT